MKKAFEYTLRKSPWKKKKTFIHRSKRHLCCGKRWYRIISAKFGKIVKFQYQINNHINNLAENRLTIRLPLNFYKRTQGQKTIHGMIKFSRERYCGPRFYTQFSCPLSIKGNRQTISYMEERREYNHNGKKKLFRKTTG